MKITEESLRHLLGNTDMYLIDLLQKGYFSVPRNILDVGCGAGRNIWMLSSLGHQITAIDVHVEAISILETEISHHGIQNVATRVGELGHLGKGTEEFDFVICNAVLHFANSMDHFRNLFLDLVSLLEPGGIGFCRFVSSHTFNPEIGPFNTVVEVPDGSSLFVVDMNWFKESFIASGIIELVEPLKTVNVADVRTMTTLVFTTK
ncbi:MAG: tellurite methyltransferase [Salibacteraceae bacterium]|jgi:SAM-dependent methyltransferase